MRALLGTTPPQYKMPRNNQAINSLGSSSNGLQLGYIIYFTIGTNTEEVRLSILGITIFFK